MVFFGEQESKLPILRDQIYLTSQEYQKKGSLKGFITRKSYNRSRRIHPTLAAVIEIFNFRKFDSRFNNESLSVINDKSKFITEKKTDLKCFSKEATEFLHGYLLYLLFLRETLEVKHWLTAQYWMGYIKMLHLYHKFSRSIWTAYLDLYIFCLPKAANHIFAFNHHSYVR